MIKAILFDLDDTLYPELSFVKSGYSFVSEKFHSEFGVGSGEMYNKLEELFAQDRKNVFDRFAPGSVLVPELISAYRFHIPDIKPYDDVKPTLDEIRRIGIKTGIITDGNAETQKNKLFSLGIHNLIDCVVYTGELPKGCGKPSALPFELAAQKLAVKPEDLIYIGDNPEKDFFVSKALPIKTVRIIREGSLYENSEYREGIKETVRIKTLKSIMGLIMTI